MGLILKIAGADIFQGGKTILADVNFSLLEGEFCYLVGKTGSGKSSLLKTIYGHLPLEKGTGEVAGFDLKSLTRHTIPMLRRRLGIVFQDFNLLEDRSVEQNLLFVLRATDWKNPAEMAARVDETLASVGLLAKKHAMPHELSGGEQQRVVIARALLNRPAILLADEPTGNLDPETSDDILTLLRSVSKEFSTAVLCATHDYRVIENFPARIVRTVNGRLLDDQKA